MRFPIFHIFLVVAIINSCSAGSGSGGGTQDGRTASTAPASGSGAGTASKDPSGNQDTPTKGTGTIPPPDSNNANTSTPNPNATLPPATSPEPPSGSCVALNFPAAKYNINVGTSSQSVCNSHPACSFIQSKYAISQAAGNVGDVYMNADGGHATAYTSQFPQLTVLPQTAVLSFGPLENLSTYEHLGKATITNGSYVITNQYGLYATPRYHYHRKNFQSYVWGVERITGWHENNIHVWHPEHQDHDAVNRFYAYHPATGVSQGSSGSELDEIGHQFAILASFRTDAKKWLRDRGLLMETVLNAHRWGRAGSDAAYLQGASHPVAMNDVSGANAVLMAQKANDMTLDKLPPFARIAVTNETFEESFLNVFNERMYTTPYAVARVYRQSLAEQSIEINAESSFDPNCAPLSYHWVVLAGEFDTQGNRRVTIEPLVSGSWKKVRIKFKPHEFTAAGTTSTTSKLMYVGLFVNNGYHYSLPAIISVSGDPSLIPN